jgi:predicted DNA-binding transcriptional regulator
MNLITDSGEKRIMNNDLFIFLKDIGCSDMQFQLLCFWGRHPKAKLTLKTVAIALDASKNSVRDAIAALVEKGILVAQHNGNGLTTYALSGDERTQRCIDELAKLDWSSIKNIEVELKKETLSTR